jgi:hypothetical protein
MPQEANDNDNTTPLRTDLNLANPPAATMSYNPARSF